LTRQRRIISCGASPKEPQGETSQMTAFFIVTTMKKSNLTWIYFCLHIKEVGTYPVGSFRKS
jgi:hypothetical protein